jgi:hypothetical protein
MMIVESSNANMMASTDHFSRIAPGTTGLMQESRGHSVEDT